MAQRRTPPRNAPAFSPRDFRHCDSFANGRKEMRHPSRLARGVHKNSLGVFPKSHLSFVWRTSGAPAGAAARRLTIEEKQK
ncbi:MAG: hypothetical protein V4567_07250 [Pseudomonadota bacterium]